MKRLYLFGLLLCTGLLLSCSSGDSGESSYLVAGPSGNGTANAGGGTVTATGTSSGTSTILTAPSVPASSYTIPVNLSAQTADIPDSLSSYVTVTSSTETVASTATTVITVNSTSPDVITYKLSGSLSNGMFQIKGSAADYIVELSGASISSTVTPAMLLKKATAYIVTDSGTMNSFSDGRDFTGSADYGDYDQKGAVHTAKDMVLSGNGTLKVTKAGYKSGIYSKGTLSVLGGTVNVTSAGKSCMGAANGFLMWDGSITLAGTGTTTDDETKGIKVDGDESADGAGLGYIIIYGGTINSSTQSKGITAGWDIDEDAETSGTSDDPNPYVEINGGTLNITTLCTPYDNGSASCSPEGIEGKAGLTINGGTITINSTDDCLNVSASGGRLVINGGSVYARSSTNDALDSNGTITINGGTVVAIGTRTPECAFDCDSNTFAVTGGLLVGMGTSNYTAPASGYCTQNTIVAASSYYSGGSPFVIKDSGGNVVFAYSVPSSTTTVNGTGDLMILSSPRLSSGSYTLCTGGTLSGGTAFNGLYAASSLPGHSGGTVTATTMISSTVTTVGNIRTGF
ncbi:MAG: carbohydrate-binding domain-containing protein [Treponema sp.]|nr:carbohydrate-binding domain-containing protein [Treponema sp.]